VIGLPDDQRGKAVTAVVVPGAGSTPTLADIADWVGSQLATLMKPKRLILADRLPGGPARKVQKCQLVRMRGNRSSWWRLPSPISD